MKRENRSSLARNASPAARRSVMSNKVPTKRAGWPAASKVISACSLTNRTVPSGHTTRWSTR